MGMGLLGYALSGAGEGLGAGIAQASMEQMKQQMEENRLLRVLEAKQKGELDLKKAEHQMADEERQARVERIDTARSGLVKDAIGRQYAESDAAVADADAGNTVPLSDEQKSVIAQSKANDTQALMNDPRTFVKAGMATGDIAPKDVLTATTKSDRNTTWQDVQMAKILAGQRNTDVRADAMTDSAQIRADASRDNAETRADAAGSRGGLTEPQRVRNYEIDAARKIIGGLTPDEIKRKTSKFTNTGRENPDYDAGIATRLRLAGQRKYGEDSTFDAQLNDTAEPSRSDVADAAQRFAADPAMKKMRMGAQTAQGREVFDANGKLIGHYR